MASKLSNDESYELTNAEIAWMYKKGIQIDIKTLKKLKKSPTRFGLLSYVCFFMMSYESGKLLSEYINKQDDGDFLIFCLTAGLAFWNNYNGVKCIKESRDYAKAIKILKSILEEYEKLECCITQVSDETLKAFKHCHDESKKLLKVYLNDDNE